MKKMIIAFTLVVVILAGFAGCQKKEAAPVSGSAAADFGARTSGPNYWWVKFDQPVTIHVVNQERPQTPFMPGDDVTRNEWTRAFKEQLNVDVVTDWVAPTANYWERVNLAIAAKEIPDVFRVNPSQYRQLVDAGLVADITDYIENNCSDMVKAIIDSSPVVTETAKINGRFMGLPRYGYGDLWLINLLWIRHDWMTKAGLSEPKSFDDLEKIMDAFMAAHPGSYGFGLRKTLEEFFYLASAFGALPTTPQTQGIWIPGPDGKLMYGSTMPEMKLALEKFTEWYRKGYLRRDFTALTDREVIEDIASEKLGIHAGQNWMGWPYTDAVKALITTYGMDAYMEPYSIPSAVPGKPHIYPMPIDNSDYIVINKNFNNIPAVLKCISYTAWVCMEATTQGALTEDQVFRYLLGGEGRHDMSMLELNDPYGNGPALVEWAHKIGLNNYEITEEPMTSEWPAQYDQASPWWKDNDIVGYGRWIQQYNPRSSAWLNLEVMNEGRYVPTRLTGALPEDVVSYSSLLDDILIEGFTRIIVGEMPLSYFDTLIAEWKAAVGDEVTQAVNRDYGN